jgi:hypothetical protein
VAQQVGAVQAVCAKVGIPYYPHCDRHLNGYGMSQALYTRAVASVIRGSCHKGSRQQCYGRSLPQHKKWQSNSSEPSAHHSNGTTMDRSQPDGASSLCRAPSSGPGNMECWSRRVKVRRERVDHIVPHSSCHNAVYNSRYVISGADAGLCCRQHSHCNQQHDGKPPAPWHVALGLRPVSLLPQYDRQIQNWEASML